MAINLSITMALESLREQVTIVNDAELHLTQERAKRDALIRDARDNGIPYRKIMALTGVSRERLFRIVNAPPVEASEHMG